VIIQVQKKGKSLQTIDLQGFLFLLHPHCFSEGQVKAGMTQSRRGENERKRQSAFQGRACI
jgi:hypothetical protein